jgi:hypothetical protein
MEDRCPICQKPVRAPTKEPSEEAKFFPFCCERCKLIDLGAWLDAKYKIASTPQSDETENPSDATTPSSDDR